MQADLAFTQEAVYGTLGVAAAEMTGAAGGRERAGGEDVEGVVEFEGFGGDGFYGGEEAVGIWLW